jgi:hypothetical protein
LAAWDASPHLLQVHYEEVSSAHFRDLAPETKIVDGCVGLYFGKTN